MPIWITSIEFNEENLQFRFDTGKGLKKVILTQGTINKYGEIIGPKGNLIGDPIHEGIQKINYDGKNFKVTFKNPFGDDTSTLDLSKEEFIKLARESKNENMIKLVETLDGDKGPIVQDLLNNLKFDADLSFNRNDKLNVLYGGDYQNEGIIEIDYDELGRLKTSLSNGGNIVSTDSNRDVTRLYKQHFSKNGLSDQRFVTGNDADGFLKKQGWDDEKGIFLFDSNGEINAAQNGIIKIRELGEIRTSRSGLIGVDIVEDSLIAKIRRGGDFKQSLGSIEGLKDLEKKVLSGKINSEIKLQREIAEAIQDKLKTKEFGTELEKNLNNFLVSVKTNLEKSQDALINDFSSTLETDSSYDQEHIKEYLENTLRSLTTKSFNAALEDPELKTLIIGNKQERRNIINKIVKGVIKDPEFKPYINSIADFLEKNPKEITSQIDGYIDEFLSESNSDNINAEANFRDEIKTKIKESFGIEDPDILDQIDSLYHAAETRVREEKEIFLSRLSTNYENKIVINSNTREVDVIGNKFIAFDAKTDLTRFTATSTRTNKDPKGEVIQLYSNGNFIARFDGKDSTIYRHINSQADLNNINIIENTLETGGRIASLQTTGKNYGPKWSITYPESLRRTKTGPITVVGVPTLGFYHAVDMELISPDLSEKFGLDIAVEGSKIIINNYAAYGTGDPNYQRALKIGAALGEQEARNIPILGRLDASRFGLGIFKRYGGREGIRTAHSEFLAGQDPQRTANQLASEIRGGFKDQLLGAKNKQGIRIGGLYRAFGSQSNYETFARNTLDKYESIFPQSALDSLYTSINKNEFEKIPKFFEANPHAIYEITPTSIKTNQGAVLNNVDERVMRAFFRDFANEVKPRIEPYTPQ